MRIFDESKEIELQEKDCDFEKGYLKPDTLYLGKRKSLKEITKDSKGNIIETTYPSLDITEDVLIYTLFTQKELYEAEIRQYRECFMSVYREQFEKCTRRIELGIKMRDGSDANEALKKLYTLAEEYADKIHNLEEKIKQIQESEK